jgi:hypothetical protein
MKKTGLVLALAASAAIVGGTLHAQSAAPAQSAALMSGREILAKSVDAMGGADAVKAIKSIHGKGSLEISGANLTGTVEIFAARPAFSRVNASIGGVGDIQSGCDGTIAWSMDPMSGAALLTGKALQENIA